MVVIRQYHCETTASWFFSNVRDAIEWRAEREGTDNVALTYGEWSMCYIGPATLPDGELVLSVVDRWQFIGEWADNGNDFAITGRKEVS